MGLVTFGVGTGRMQEGRFVSPEPRHHGLHHVPRAREPAEAVSHRPATLQPRRVQPVAHQRKALAAMVDLAVLHTRYGVSASLGCTRAAQSPELKSVNSTWPFHGMAFITNDAFGVNPVGSYGLNTAISRP